MSMYRVCFLDKFDTRQYRFVQAYTAKQAEFFCKKTNGWNIRILDITEIEMAEA